MNLGTTNQELFNRARTLAETVISRRLKEILDGDQLLKILRMLITIRRDKRFYTITDSTDLENIWNYVRADDIVLDFIMESFIEWRLRYTQVDSDWSNLVSTISVAYGGSKETRRGMDSALVERLPSINDVVTLLQGSQWIVFLFVWINSDFPEMIEMAKAIKADDEKK